VARHSFEPGVGLLALAVAVALLVFPVKYLRESKDIRIQRALAFLASHSKVLRELSTKEEPTTIGLEGVARD
jgi:hypothetical protein